MRIEKVSHQFKLVKVLTSSSISAFSLAVSGFQPFCLATLLALSRGLILSFDMVNMIYNTSAKLRNPFEFSKKSVQFLNF